MGQDVLDSKTDLEYTSSVEVTNVDDLCTLQLSYQRIAKPQPK